jgi:hypothetical protein
MNTNKRWSLILFNVCLGLMLGFVTPQLLFHMSVLIFGGIAGFPICTWHQTERRISPDRRLVAIGELWTCEDDGESGPRFTVDLASRTGQFEGFMYAVHLGRGEVPTFRWTALDHLQIYAPEREPEFPPRVWWCGAYVERKDP